MAYVSFPGSDDDFMNSAFIEALNSDDPSTKVGVCIVYENGQIVGKGFNRFPKIAKRFDQDFDENYPWSSQADNWDEWLESKYAYLLFADVDAITNCKYFDECTLYTLMYPSNVGAQLIVKKGIRKVVYYSDKYQNSHIIQASRRILCLAEVEVKKFQPKEENKAYFDKMARITVEIPQ